MKVLVADPIAADGVEILREGAEVDVKTGLSNSELLSIVGEYEALVVRSETKVTAEVIEAGTRLQVVGRAGVGVDNIDLDAATRRGVFVVNAPSGNTVAAAEHTIALMLSLARMIPQADASLRAGEWARSKFIGTEVRHKVLGLVGLGKVGTGVARRAQGLEMRVIAYDPFISQDYARNLGLEVVGLEELLQRSDFVSVHVPLTNATKGLIGRQQLALMKPTARIINCARGGIIDEQALFEFLEEGRLAGAAVDVFSKEPAIGNILLRSSKVVATPHLGASTKEAQVSVAVDVAGQVLAVLRGQPARYAVNVPLIPPDTLSIIGPYMTLAERLGRLATQLAEGQLEAIGITYQGDIAQHDVTPLKASTIKGLLDPISEERVNLVNANIVAKSRGLRIIEQKGTTSENYSNLITVEVTTSKGTTTVSGTVLRGAPHIVQIDGYWVDLVPTDGHLLVSQHLDRPGMIGSVGTLLGNADINISFMQVGRLTQRGKALMVLGLDEAIPDDQLTKILAIPDVYTAKVVQL